MDSVRIIEIKESVFADNDREADRVRAKLKEEKTFLLNLMSSPGSGKTTTLLRTIERLKDDLRIGVMEADIDSSVDAETIARAGVKSIQLHTGGMCHLDAGMTEQGLTELGTGRRSRGARKCRQSRLPGGVRYGRGEKRNDPLRAGGPR